MANTSAFQSITRQSAACLRWRCPFRLPLAGRIAQVDKVTTYKDEHGWKLLVNGEDYYIKGVVWSYSPRGQNYSYNLFGQSDDFIRKSWTTISA